MNEAEILDILAERFGCDRFGCKMDMEPRFGINEDGLLVCDPIINVTMVAKVSVERITLKIEIKKA